MESIGISEVLARISDTVDLNTAEPKHFGIRFYTARGELREVSVRKYTRAPGRRMGLAEERGKAAHSLQRNGLVKFVDLTNNRIIDVRATSLYGFRGFNSSTWLKVYH